METVQVKVGDKYGDTCLKDSVNPISGKDRKPEGFVEIYEVEPNGNKHLVGKSNLVLYVGREWIVSRLFNQENLNITPDEDEFITWFGVGSGGAPIGDPLNPSAITSTNTGLASEIGICTPAVNPNCADLRTGTYYKHPFDSIEFQQDAANNNQYLIAKVTITLGTDDANGNNINEAGLFTADSSAGGHGGPFNIFSLVTFPTIVKDSSRQIMFMWYIYC